MIPPRVGLVAVAVLATALAPRRHSLRPVAATLCALAAVNVLHSDAAIPARVDVALWLAWPGVAATLAWQAWRSDVVRVVKLGRRDPQPPRGIPASSDPSPHSLPGVTNTGSLGGGDAENERAQVGDRIHARILAHLRRWHLVALAFALYAPAVLWAPWSWSAHPVAWWLASRVPHVVAVVVAVAAWALAPKMPRTPAQAVATLLAISGALDLVVGALAPGAGWVRAAPLAWITWGACAVVVGWEARRGRARL